MYCDHRRKVADSRRMMAGEEDPGFLKKRKAFVDRASPTSPLLYYRPLVCPFSYVDGLPNDAE